MRENTVKKTLLSGGTSVGTMVFEFNTTGIARICAEAGADFFIADMEHTGWSIESIRALMASAGGANTIPMVRVPATQYHLISRPLDVGAMGIMVPMVEDEAQARTIANSVRYPPAGGRGCAFGVAHDDYTGGDVFAKMLQANDNVFTMAQIETAKGVDNCEAIAAVEGIDCLWVGHFDLTASMGIAAQFDHPDFLAALDRVVAACNANGKVAGIMAGTPAVGKQWQNRGFRAIAYSGDLWILQQAMAEGIAALR
ncbi:MAG: aldolase/citrate lyase family protein [Chloroflexota bacterium]|jgi:2-keto-3-deoxy-L-rhamnonate aldolase RhmA|nr:aldolase/citrate lyase family protein [Chloroflexota bacterium]